MFTRTNQKKKTLFVLFAALLALFSVGTSFAAGPDGSSPDQGLTPGSEMMLEAGESVWYAFHYGLDVNGDPADVSIWVEGYPDSGTNFEVWNTQRLQEWAQQKAGRDDVNPVGMGSDSDYTAGNYFWTGEFNESDMYYVLVENKTQTDSTHMLHIKGDTVILPEVEMTEETTEVTEETTEVTEETTEVTEETTEVTEETTEVTEETTEVTEETTEVTEETTEVTEETTEVTEETTEVTEETTEVTEETTEVTEETTEVTEETTEATEETTEATEETTEATEETTEVTEETTPEAVSENGTSPENALRMSGEWKDLQAGASIWYAFDYTYDSGDVAQASVWMNSVPDNGINFEIWTPELLQKQAQNSSNDEVYPVGRGNQSDYTDGDYFWTGKFSQSGTYYVLVKNMNPTTSYYQLYMDNGN